MQQICYRLKRHDVRGTVRYVEKGCRDVTSCTSSMYSGLCDGQECVQCIDNPSTCSVPGGKRKRYHMLNEASIHTASLLGLGLVFVGLGLGLGLVL